MTSSPSHRKKGESPLALWERGVRSEPFHNPINKPLVQFLNLDSMPFIVFMGWGKCIVEPFSLSRGESSQ